MKKLAVLLANGFGLGLSPIASGTVGTLLALPIVWLFCQLLEVSGGVVWQCVIALGLSLLAIPICSVAEKHYGTKDDGRIVADEYLTFPICMIGLPWNPWVLLVAFLSCRFFDIVKPPPANQLQRIRGGFGIVVDDVMASLYSLAFNYLVFRFVLVKFVELG
ncbi:MAG: phosphatidylglycerophosphatase A [Verrucomicrobia bacterium]|jgi:phosphatidylglycerophosphatase A|nr:phosphatidylglycerophosphatase A [Verrucomicrobiota bacterium]